MSERPVYLTQEGYQQLVEELNQLRTIQRPKVAQRLHDALAEGELIENAELEDARREQAFTEQRIYILEQQLRNAILIEKTSAPKDIVGIGSHITVREAGTDMPEVYHMVGSAEASPMEGKISNESPLGKVLLGKRVGDKATVRAPDGDIVFEILEIAWE
ncbi:MAG: transcription elongation factor GreA [Anaerolineae bacterium]|jgi:transcription elongation factor GreA|nr:transcription elongation factor GreA [Anaerolineae bacterium]